MTWHGDGPLRHHRPDTCYGMELVGVSDIVADMGFKVFCSAAGGSVKVPRWARR